MYAQEKINPYNKDGKKGAIVREMFNTISPKYDRMNHLLSWGTDRGWRRKVIDQLAPFAPKHILDVATGTGDLAILAANRLAPSQIIGADFSENMTEIGRAKVAKKGLNHVINFAQEDCMALSFKEETFDAVITSFGIRNFENLDKGLNEMCRVLKKGGHLSMAELTTPAHFPMKQLFSIYSHTILPLYGNLISHNTDAYRYLTTSIEAFPQGEQMVEILKKAGFEQASFKRLCFGICTLYFATK